MVPNIYWLKTTRGLLNRIAAENNVILVHSLSCRVFSLIEGLALDHHESAAAREKASSVEAVLEAVLRSAIITLFQQMSPSLFKVTPIAFTIYIQILCIYRYTGR